jgi:hypothetical protein
VILGGEECADIALKHEVRLHRALDRLCDVGVGSVDQVAQLMADVLLSVRQPGNVVVDAGVSCVGHVSST